MAATPRRKLEDAIEQDKAYQVEDDDVDAEDFDFAADKNSTKLEIDPETGLSFFATIHCGVLHANLNDLRSEDSAAVVAYEDGFEIMQAGEIIGTMVKRLGAGSFGTVYLCLLPNGMQCAAKSVSEKFAAGEARHKVEKQLAAECSIGFAMGRSPHTASVVRMIVPDEDTNVRGMLLLCDLVDSGDLEEAMHSGKLNDQKKLGFSVHETAKRGILF